MKSTAIKNLAKQPDAESPLVKDIVLGERHVSMNSEQLCMEKTAKLIGFSDDEISILNYFYNPKPNQTIEAEKPTLISLVQNTHQGEEK